MGGRGGFVWGCDMRRCARRSFTLVWSAAVVEDEEATLDGKLLDGFRNLG